MDYLIYCPDYLVKHFNAVGLDGERIVDGGAKDGLAGRIQKVLGAGTTGRDEGQDFEEEWFEILQLFLRPGAGILWLEDPDQNLQDKALVSMEGFVRYRTLVNYRSPESVARFIRNTLGVR